MSVVAAESANAPMSVSILERLVLVVVWLAEVAAPEGSGRDDADTGSGAI